MELIWKQLVTVMERLADKARSMAELAKTLRHAIIHEQIREIGERVIEQENLMQQFQGLEKEREALTASLGATLHLAEPEQVSSRLLSHVPPEWSNDYRLAVARLRDEVGHVKQENEVNHRLLRQSQQFMGWLVNSLVTPIGATALYDGEGSQAQKSYYHFINQSM